MISKILDRLYVGDCDFDDYDLEHRFCIGHVINVGGVEMNPPVKYTPYHLNDNGSNPSYLFSTILGEIEGTFRGGWGRVLVCCRAGMSRSVFIVILWLERMGMSRDEAYAYVKARHPIAQVNLDLWRSV